MQDKTRLAITGVVAFVALAATVGGHGLKIAFDSDDEAGDRRTLTLPDLKDFRAVSLSGPDDVVISRGARYAVKVEGDKASVDQLSLSVEDGTLRIGRRDGWMGGGGRGARVQVTLPVLEAVSLTGSGDMRVDRLDGQQVRIEMVGAGDLDVGLVQADAADVSLTGAGDLKIAGKARSATLRTAGAGDISADGLATEQVKLDLIGAGDVTVRASKAAEISIVGPGKAQVIGTAACRISKTGPGEAICSK
jgi:hypothetical protein